MLCYFACEFPQFVAGFLHGSRGTGRSFREETITDIMMANLKLLGRDRVIVRFPNESRTGADMEWNFVNRSDGSYYRLLIQANSHRAGHRTGRAILIDSSLIVCAANIKPISFARSPERRLCPHILCISSIILYIFVSLQYALVVRMSKERILLMATSFGITP